MTLEIQFKVLMYSFIYGMFICASIKFNKRINIKNKLLKYAFNFFYCILLASLFYFLLYKINYGELNYYMFVLLCLGYMFCHFVYFKDKKL